MILVEHSLIVEYFNHNNPRYNYVIEGSMRVVGGCLGNSNATLSDVGKQIQKEHAEASNIVRREATEDYWEQSPACRWQWGASINANRAVTLLNKTFGFMNQLWSFILTHQSKRKTSLCHWCKQNLLWGENTSPCMQITTVEMPAIYSEAAAQEDIGNLTLEKHWACTHMHTTATFANHDSQSGLQLPLLSVQDEICQAIKPTLAVAAC